ncbi:MAG: hypothetical protein CM1200mP14_24460 [Gammaproteobacteria bacterium]|nr:MAG: hypothetical protein CM1200mP14_24460 [Gammaproteobacteria bacterium]
MSIALIFPGQGSQYVGMAKALAETEPIAAETLALQMKFSDSAFQN